MGVTQRSDTVARQLTPQDGLFTVAERGSGAAPLRVVSSIVEAISGRDNPGKSGGPDRRRHHAGGHSDRHGKGVPD